MRVAGAQAGDVSERINLGRRPRRQLQQSYFLVVLDPIKLVLQLPVGNSADLVWFIVFTARDGPTFRVSVLDRSTETVLVCRPDGCQLRLTINVELEFESLLPHVGPFPKGDGVILAFRRTPGARHTLATSIPN